MTSVFNFNNKLTLSLSWRRKSILSDTTAISLLTIPLPLSYLALSIL